ncbi:uncharacterized protein LOC113329906 isoform X1 [Papaver somniferum]|uniref:uncharacterized protein LOC113329906 isoform X1 n=1 Tax=Papaver somniferum TaxID=3469 RepID=UPI000E703EAB|nr:uncharacterized protein LOC113329906 isoform X1 [Papaver somniferum]
MRCRRKSGVISLDQLRSLSRTISGSTGGRKAGSMSSSGFSSSGSFASLNLVADKRRDQEQASLVTPLKMEKQKLAAVDAHLSSSYSGISVGGVAPALSLSTQGTPKDSTGQLDNDKISEDKQAEKPNPKSLLSPTVQCAPESDDPYSPFHATQWIPTKYSNSDSSVSGPPISMPEELKGHGTTVMGQYS